MYPKTLLVDVSICRYCIHFLLTCLQVISWGGIIIMTSLCVYSGITLLEMNMTVMKIKWQV